MNRAFRVAATAVAALFIASAALAQSIVTVAGGGSDDGQQATNIALFGPEGLAFDSAGRLVVVERFQGIIRRIDLKSGTVQRIAGVGASGFSGDGGPARKAALNQPSSLFVDGSDNIYVADAGNGRVRRIDAKTGVITTVAGRGSERSDGTIGDNGPATDAVLRAPWGVWIDRGNLYITEAGFQGQRVRKVVLSTGVITTMAGPADGSPGLEGDGGPALNAKFNNPLAIVADTAGNLFVADSDNHRVRRIDAATGNIETYAGAGSDNLDYTAALTFDGNGNLLIDSDTGVHRVDKSTRALSAPLAINYGRSYGIAADANNNLFLSSDAYGAIVKFTPASSTDFTVVAGGGGFVGDGLPATAAILRQPQGVAVDAAGNILIADSSNLLVRRVDAQSGLISTYAGNGLFYDNNEDGKPANQSAMSPVDVALDRNGDLYIADRGNNRVKKVDARTGILTFYAGNGNGSDGTTKNDGLPALQAAIDPVSVAFDTAGNLFAADPTANRVWKIDAVSKIVSTFAGTGKDEFSGDGGLATAAGLSSPVDVVFDADGNGYISDSANLRIRKVTPAGTISNFAGGGESVPPFGDGGPATQAYLSPGHLAIDRGRGKLYIADTNSSRVRVIDLRSGIIDTVAGSGTFSYVDADFSGDNGPAKSAKLNFPFTLGGVTVDPTGNVFVADTNNNRLRAVFACVSVNAPLLVAPADNAANASTAPTLTWNSVNGAARYDVLLDTTSPPTRVIASDLTEFSFAPSNLQPNTKYFWAVVAKSDIFCPSTSQSTSLVRSFTTAAGCSVGPFDLIAPANGATNVPAATLQLTWQAAPGAGTYDVYFGPNNPPPLVASGLTQTSYRPGLVGGFWFVVAHAQCDPTKTFTTSVRGFGTDTAAGCNTPPNVSIASPANGASGVALSADLTWTDTSRVVDTFDVYFGTVPDPPLLRRGLAADVRSVTVSFLDAATTYYWRVVANSACGLPPVSTPTVTFTTRPDCATPGATQIIFAPQSVTAGATYTIVWSVASGLDADGTYLVERSTSSSFSPVLDAQVSSSTAATFIAASIGTYYHRVRAVPSCDATKSGPVSDVKSVNVTAAPANVIFTVQPSAVITALGEKLEDRSGTFTLENIGSAPAQVIVGQSLVQGSKPFFSINEGGAFITLAPRSPRTFTIQYSGPPADVAASYQGVIFVAGVGQPLPVTPYAFVNLKVGGGPAVAPQFVVDGNVSEYVSFPGFAGADDSSRPAREISIRNPGTTPMELAAEIGPEVWLVPESGWNSQPLAAGATRTVKLFTRRTYAPNGSPLPRYTYFTVRTKDGASARLLVQDNDKLAVSSDPPQSLDVTARSFIITEVTTQSSARVISRLRLSNSGGDSVQVELIFRSPLRRAVVVVPPNDVVTLIDPLTQLFSLPDGTSGSMEARIPVPRLGLIAITASTVDLNAGSSTVIPVVTRGAGARLGVAHVIYIPSNTAATTLTLTETSGADFANVTLVVDGQSSTQRIPPYATTKLTFSAPKRIDINVQSAGSVIGFATVNNATFLSRLANATAAAKWAGALAGPPSVTTVIPVISGSSSTGATPSYRTQVGFIAPLSSPGVFNVSFYPSGGGAALIRPVTVSAGQVTVYNDISRELLGLTTASDGNLFVEGPPAGKVVAVLQTGSSSGTFVPASSLPLPSTLGEAQTSATSAAQRPLSFDGLEQSTDPSRGTRWMLLLNEVGGGSGFINVRLYEAGNRSQPIADRDMAVNANQQVKLDTIFAALGLDSADRRKDRTNVQVVVTATAGTARVAASAVSIDNRTGDTKVVPLEPAIGSGNPNVTFAAPVLTQPTTPGKHRSVHH